MENSGQWYWWITAILLAILATDIIVDIWYFPTIRNLKQRVNWWWKWLRWPAYWLALVLGFMDWLITWPASRLSARANKKKEVAP